MPDAIAPITGAVPLDDAPAASSTNGGFASALGTAALDAAQTLRTAEATAARALTGDAGIRETVDAVLEAERTVRAASAIRDKIVSGWLDVSRMSI